MIKWRYPDKPTEITPETLSHFREADYIAQGKYDGYRLVCCLDNDGWEFLTRNNKPVSRHPVAKSYFTPELRAALEKLDVPKGTYLDAELVGPRGHQKPEVYIFDVIRWQERWLSTMPFESRWGLCNQIPRWSSGIVHLAWTFEIGFLAEFNRLKAEWIARGRGIDMFEGLVIKLRKGTMTLDLTSCTKSKSMFKAKYRDIETDRF